MVGGVLSAILGIIYLASNGSLIETWQYSYFTSWGIGTLENNLIIGISIETLINIVGGLICLITKPK